MKIVVDDKIPYLEGVLERYFSEVVYYSGRDISSNIVADADVLLIRTRTKCNEKLLAGSKVKMIATATIGHDHIDKEYCKEHGILWTNAPGCNAFGVVQYVLCFLSLISQKGYGSLQGKTLGIVGVGEVGKRLAAVAPYLGLNVLKNDPPRARKEGDDGFVSLDELVVKSDIISVHVPLNRGGEDRTFGLFNEGLFGLFQQPKVFINASRGEVVHEPSLKEAIKAGKMRHVALDVWCNEPEIDKELMELVDIATPHIAGYSLEGKANGTAASVNSILHFFGLGDGDKWYPSSLPSLENKITFGSSKNVEDEVLSCILKTYNIESDNDNLRRNPDDFESLRGNYGVRREFSYYKVVNVKDERAAACLNGLTFKVE